MSRRSAPPSFGNVSLGKATRQLTEAPGGRAIEIVNKPLNGGGWVATIEDITDRKRAELKIAHLAHYDALTDLPNRVLLHEKLERALKEIQPSEQLAVLYIDIDEFKSVNDALGHAIGDELLKTVADRLRGCLGEADIAARLGGDEFAVIQMGVTSPAETTRLVDAIHAAIRQPLECAGHLITTDASIGIAMAPNDGVRLDQLLKNADLALYGAKGDGRRTYRFFEPGMDARAKARRTLEMELRRAINDGSFEVHYQPLLTLRDDSISGCEALLRWRHPLRGMISPAEFIPGCRRDRADQRARSTGTEYGVHGSRQMAAATPASPSTCRRSSSGARRWPSTWRVRWPLPALRRRGWSSRSPRRC